MTLPTRGQEISSNFVLPSDFKVRYSDPASIQNFIQDPDTFEYRFDGKVCNVTLQSQMTAFTQITGLTVGPATSFRGVYIRKYWRDKLVEDFSFIWSVSFQIPNHSSNSNLGVATCHIWTGQILGSRTARLAALVLILVLSDKGNRPNYCQEPSKP